MDISAVNYIAVILAAIASYAFGAGWYMLLANPWMAALGKTEADIKGPDGKGPSPVPFIASFVAQLVMAFVFVNLLGHFGADRVTLTSAVLSGVMIWLGFVATTLVTNHAFQGAKPSLTLIDGGHWLGVLVLQGAVIGLVGV
ncbi:MAG: DUF1761 domain-containing protein [Pseudomonadota bacterium]